MNNKSLNATIFHIIPKLAYLFVRKLLFATALWITRKALKCFTSFLKRQKRDFFYSFGNAYMCSNKWLHVFIISNILKYLYLWVRWIHNYRCYINLTRR